MQVQLILIIKNIYLDKSTIAQTVYVLPMLQQL